MSTPQINQKHQLQNNNIIHNDTIREIGQNEIEEIFSPLKQIHAWKQNMFDFLQETIQYIHKLVKKEKMENTYIRDNLWSLSTREILSRGKTFYMNPCLDYVLVTMEALKKSGIKNTIFVVDELACPGNFYKLHFGIEIPHEWENYYIDYRTKNDVFIGKGNFESKYHNKGEIRVNTIKINAHDISLDDSLPKLIERWLLSFKYFDPRILDILKQKLQADNSEDERKNFRKEIGDIEKPNIFKENN